MKLKVIYQERYSRGELLLRTLFGGLYILLPHMFILVFVQLWGFILQFVAFWIILFTGNYPQNLFDYQLGLLRWSLRLNARIFNVSDGYPAFGLKGTDEFTQLEVKYPESVNRGLVILRLLFGVIYVGIPHGFILLFRSLFVGILVFISWWAVLFTGKFPKTMFDWIVGQFRWETRISLYMRFMTDTYPAFTGDELPDEV